MNRYNRKIARWQQQNKEEQKKNKTEFIKVRCTSVLQHTGRFYGQISNLIKVKDERWVHITQNLSLCVKEAFKRFYDPHFRVDDEIYKVLNMTRNDRKM